MSQQPTKHSGHGHCGRGDIIVLICHMILQDHLTKGLGNFAGGTCSMQVTILSSLVVIGTMVVNI